MAAVPSALSKAGSTYLAIDIGGTKTVLALYRATEEPDLPLAQKRFRSADFGGIEEIILDFLAAFDFRPESVILGIAGVAGETRSRVTNLPWVITKSGLHDMGFTTVCMINDMTALAASLPLLRGEEDILCLQEGSRSFSRAGEVTAVLAPGTGLGEGYLFKTGNGSVPRGTEGGHCAFGPDGDEQLKLLTWLAGTGHAGLSYETVCAGPAIGLLYEFYISQGEEGDRQVRLELERATDKTPVVINAALSGTCSVCRKVVDLFLSILGREGANLVLKVYATDGLFLGGGILPRLAGHVSFEPFLRSFRQEGPMAELLRSVPVNLILRRDAVLLGVASHGRDFLSKVRAHEPKIS